MAPPNTNLAQPLAEPTATPAAGAAPTLTVTHGIRAPATNPRRRILAVLALGAASGLLYGLLFLYADQLSALSQLVRDGAKHYALVPIAIALVFSLVHGAFTGRFWDLLGLKARTN